MPTYQVDVGDKTYEVDAPDPKTAWSWANTYASTPPPAAPAPKEESSDFVRGFKSYIPQTEETIGGVETVLGAGAKKLLGQGAISDYLLKGGAEKLKEAQEKQEAMAKPTDSLANAWNQGIGTVLTDWLPYQIGSGAANMLETGATAVGGALVGSVLPVEGTITGGVAGLVAKSMVKKGIKEAAEKILKESGEEAAKTYVENQAKKEIVGEEAKTLAKSGAKAYGSMAGSAAEAVYHGVGEVGSRAAEQAEEEGKRPEDMDLSKVGPAAAAHALADYAAERIGLGSLRGLSGSTKNVFLDVGANMLLTGAKEVPPELLQQAAERYGANLPLTDKNAINEYIDTAGAAFGMSVMPGALGGVRTRLASAAEQKTKEQEHADETQPVDKPDHNEVSENERTALDAAMKAAEKVGVPLTKTAQTTLFGVSPNTQNQQLLDTARQNQFKLQQEAEQTFKNAQLKAEAVADPFITAARNRIQAGEDAEKAILATYKDLTPAEKEQLKALSPEEKIARQEELANLYKGISEVENKPLTQEEIDAKKAEISARLGLNVEPKDIEQAPKTTPFRKFLLSNGLKPEESLDVTGEQRKVNANRKLPGFFRKDGLGIDDLAQRAYEDGYLLESDMEYDGGVSKLQEMIKDELNGEEQKNVEDQKTSAEKAYEAYQQELLDDAANQYGIDTDGMSPERIASMVSRIERKLEESKAKQLKAQEAIEEAKRYADKFEANRERYAEDNEDFANLPVASQDDILDVVLDNDGNPTVMSHASPSEAEDMAVRGIVPEDVMHSTRAFNGHNTTREQERNAKELKGKTLLEVAQWAVDNAPNKMARYFADLVNKRIQGMAQRGMKMDFQILDGATRTVVMRNANGRTSFIWGRTGENTSVSVQLNGPTVVRNQATHPPGTDYTTILHELLHVATRGQLKLLNSTDPIVKELNALFVQVHRHLTSEIRAGRKTDFMDRINRLNNALESVDEMVTWSITDRDMQDFMSSIMVGPKTAFNQVVNLVRRVLGVAPNFESALDKLVRTTDIILKEDVRKIGREIEQQGYSFGSKQIAASSRIRQQSLFSKRVQHLFADEMDTRRQGFYFNAKESPLYKTRTAQEVDPVTKEQADKAISANKTGARIMEKNVPLHHGDLIGARLDLNILKNQGVPVLAIHKGSESDKFPHGSTAGYWSKEVIKYLPVVTMRNVFFKVSQPIRERIAAGLQYKEPMGSADGKYVPTDKPSFDGVEMGFNPKSTHLFQDALGRVLKYADEVTITGNKMFARGNLEYYGQEDVPARAGNAPTTGKLLEPGKVSEQAKAAPTPIQDELFNKRDSNVEDTLSAINLPKTKQEARAMAQAALQKRAPMNTKAFQGMSAAAVARIQPKFYAPNITILDRIDGLKDNFFKHLAQKTVDQFRSIKGIYEDIEKKTGVAMPQLGYMMARMSRSIDGALEGLLFYGHVFNDGGALNIKNGTKGLIDILKPLGEEVDRFQIWMALNREARLPAEKRSDDLKDLVADLPEYTRGTINGKPRALVYEETRKKMQELNKSVLDVAKSMGLLDDEAYKRFSNDMFYVPFYRAMEDGNVESIKTASTLTSQYFSKELKGNNEKAFGDLMENVLRNWSHILSASAKNQAAVQTLKDAETIGAVTRLGTNAGPKKDTAVKVRENGELVYYDVHEPMLLESISNITFLGKSNAYLDVAKAFKNAIRFGVTLSPAFKVSNLIKDSIQSAAVSGLSTNIGKNLIDGWALSSRDNPAYASMLAGGAIFNFGTNGEGDQAAMVKRLIAKGVNRTTILTGSDSIKDGLKKLFDAYEDLGNRSEAANRAALYQQLRAKGLSHLEASFQARDLMDFSMQGSSNAFRYLTTTVPFLNARLQGLYKLGRDGILPTSRVIYNTVTGKPIEATDKQKAAQFSVVTGSVMLASMLLYLAFKDDDDFKKREDWDRDNFWWIKLPGMDAALRIPKPFEIGAFGTLAERTLEQIVDKDVEGKKFGDSISRMLTNTFSLNPIPQFAKPLVDIYANKDSFTGAPIETAGLERLSKQERMTESTSPIAKALGGISHAVASVTGEGTELSPVQIDYLIRAYLGWMGGTAESISYYAMMPFNDGAYPDMKKLDAVSLGFIKSLPSNQSAYVNDFYENSKLINQAYADMRHYAELGDFDKVAEIKEEKGDKIALQKMYDATAKKMAKARQQIMVITEDKQMTGTEKREEIDRLKEIINRYAQQAEELRKSYK